MSSTWIKHSYSLSRVWQTELQVINLETNCINISEQIDLYMHQNASIYVFVCIYIQNICINIPILYNFIILIVVWGGLE